MKIGRGQRGAAGIVMVGVLFLALALTLAAGRLGSAVGARARAETAAEFAALAAADALAVGDPTTVAVAAAMSVAAANDARLVSCDCAGTVATVVVEVDVRGASNGRVARGRARAEVRLECTVLVDVCRGS